MIITISREFGSGGRELGKRIADILGFSYYDKEIIAAISKEGKWDEEYIDKILTKSTLRTYPITINVTKLSEQRNSNTPEMAAHSSAKASCVLSFSSSGHDNKADQEIRLKRSFQSKEIMLLYR